MKKSLRFFAVLFIAFAFVLTGCAKKKDYKDYIGYQFGGKDPWDNELAVTIRIIENDKITWTFTDVIGEGEDSLTLYNELTTDLKDDKTSFNAKGKAENNHTFDYTGTLALKDGKLVITFEKGSLTSNSTEGGSTSHNVGGLEENAKTVTLTKAEDKS